MSFAASKASEDCLKWQKFCEEEIMSGIKSFAYFDWQ